MKTPKVSVIIPAYNSEQFIGETLDSVFRQSYQDFEVIVVDDGSSDGTDKVVSRYEGRLTYIRKKNEGISTARNVGIKAAQGGYIAFLDHDDIWLAEKLKEQVTLLEDNPEVCLVFSDAYIIDEKGKRSGTLFKISRPHSGMVFQQLLKENFIPVLTAMARKEVFKEAGLFNACYRIAEDWDLFLRIAKRYPVTFVNRPLAEYRIHPGSFSRQRDVMFAESINILNKYTSLADKATASALKRKKCKFQFELGMEYLHSGMVTKARDYFLTKVRQESLPFCFYLGLLITYLPDGCLKFISQNLSSKWLHDYGY